MSVRPQIDSDGESIAKNKGIADEFEKSGWVVRAFASLADAERAFHPFVKVVIARFVSTPRGPIDGCF